MYGAANASAQIFRFAAQAAGAEIGITEGQALARYQNEVGWGQAKVYDLGILETLLGGSCDGSAPTLNPATIPQELLVDSRDPNAAAGLTREAYAPGKDKPGALLGTQSAAAGTGPTGSGTSVTEPLDFGLVSLSRARATTRARVVDGGTRESSAEVDIDEVKFLGGLVGFKGLRWKATTRTGAVNANETSFAFESASLLGFPLPVGQAEGQVRKLFADVSRTLEGIGFRLDYPAVEVEGPVVRITPLAIRLVDSPAGKESFAPALANFQPLRQKLFAALLAFDCNFETVITILDVVFGVLAGSGGIHIEAGGLQVSTDATDFTNPFGAAGLGGATGRSGGGGAGAAGHTTGSAGATATPVPAAPTAAPDSEPPVEIADVPASSRTLPGRTGGTALLVGAIGVGGVLALALVDVTTMRRSRRRIPDA